MKKIISFLLLTLIVFLLVSCSKRIVFDEKVSFPNANWAFENKALTFQVPLTGSEKPHTVVIELDLTGTPNVDLMSTTFTIITPNGGTTVKGFTFNFNNPQEPYIQGAAENEKIYRMVVYPKRYFSETGVYTFEVNQFSNKADNYNIRALRMYIKKVKEER